MHTHSLTHTHSQTHTHTHIHTHTHTLMDKYAFAFNRYETQSSTGFIQTYRQNITAHSELLEQYYKSYRIQAYKPVVPCTYIPTYLPTHTHSHSLTHTHTHTHTHTRTNLWTIISIEPEQQII
jgi:hypothetical protein